MKATQSGEYKMRQRHKKKKLRNLDKLKEIVEARYTKNVQSTKDYQATITQNCRKIGRKLNFSLSIFFVKTVPQEFFLMLAAQPRFVFSTAS